MVRLFRRRRDEPAESENAELDEAYEGATRATRRGVLGRLGGLFRGATIDDDFWEELEETLILGDLGGETSARLVEELRDATGRRDDPEAVRGRLREQLVELLEGPSSDGALWSPEVETAPPYPHVILVVGVNGSGKTTSIAKLAHALREEGRSVYWPPPTPSAPPRSSSSRPGRSASASNVSRTRWARIPAPWPTTRSRPPTRAASMS